MLRRKEGYKKFIPRGISKRYSVWVNDKLLFWFKNNIKDGDKLWASVGYPDFIYGGFNVDNSEGKSEDFPVGLIKGV